MSRLPFAIVLIACLAPSCRLVRGGEFASPDAHLAERIERRVGDLRYARGAELIEAIAWLRRAGEPAFPRLIGGLRDEHPGVRAGSALVLGSSGDRRLIPYLKERAEDPDPAVRYEFARALVRLGDWSAVPALLGGLRDPSPYWRGLCHDILRTATRLDFGFSPVGAEPEREAAVARWEAWWATRRADPFFGG